MRRDAATEPTYVVSLGDIPWETARYPDEDFDRGEYRDIGGALGSQAVGANIHRLHPGQENARYHAHEFEEELFLVLEGSPTLRLDGHTFRLSKGHLVHCPPWSAHTFRNESDEVCSILMASNRCGRSDAVYPGWKAERRAAGDRQELDPRDDRVRHAAELGWENDPHGRVWGGLRDITGRMGLKAIASEVRTLRPGALLPYIAFPAAESIYLLLEGSLEMLHDGEVHAIEEGSAVWAPAGCPHAFRLREHHQCKLFVFRDRPPGDKAELPTPPDGWQEPVRI